MVCKLSTVKLVAKQMLCKFSSSIVACMLQVHGTAAGIVIALWWRLLPSSDGVQCAEQAAGGSMWLCCLGSIM